MAKFYEEVCLLEQPFVKEDTLTIDQLVKTKIAKLGENITVARFVRFKVGDVAAIEAGGENAALEPVAKPMPGFKRILLKLSGEVLAGGASFGIDAERVKTWRAKWPTWPPRASQIGVVVGGGNIFRGVAAAAQNMDRVTADHMGMLATVINSLALSDALEQIGIPTRVMSAIEMHQVAEPYIRRRAIRHLEKGRIVIFAAGTSNPYFSTDTAATLRALEIKAEVIAKATRVDGVYDKDPLKFPDAVKYRGNHLPRSAVAGPGSDGRHLHRHVPRQQAAHYRFQSEYDRQYNANGDGRTRRHRDSLSSRDASAAIREIRYEN